MPREPKSSGLSTTRSCCHRLLSQSFGSEGLNLIIQPSNPPTLHPALGGAGLLRETHYSSDLDHQGKSRPDGLYSSCPTPTQLPGSPCLTQQGPPQPEFPAWGSSADHSARAPDSWTRGSPRTPQTCRRKRKGSSGTMSQGFQAGQLHGRVICAVAWSDI